MTDDTTPSILDRARTLMLWELRASLARELDRSEEEAEATVSAVRQLVALGI